MISKKMLSVLNLLYFTGLDKTKVLSKPVKYSTYCDI